MAEVISSPMLDGSTSLVTGGSAQNLFNSQVPQNGFCVGNPDPTNDLWVCINGNPAAANGQGSIRVVANGGYYATEVTQRPAFPVSVYGAVTGQKITAYYW